MCEERQIAVKGVKHLCTAIAKRVLVVRSLVHHCRSSPSLSVVDGLVCRFSYCLFGVVFVWKLSLFDVLCYVCIMMFVNFKYVSCVVFG